LSADSNGGRYESAAADSPDERSRRGALDPEALFRTGVLLLKQEERIFEAVAALERAFRSRPVDARYASYYGLSLALSADRLKDAEALCAHAVKMDSHGSDLYYNLGKVRLLRNDRKGAYAAFKRGLSVDPGDTRIRQELANLGKRRPPVIPFLRRRHPLNKLFGLLMSRYVLRRARSD